VPFFTKGKAEAKQPSVVVLPNSCILDCLLMGTTGHQGVLSASVGLVIFISANTNA